MTVGKLTTPTGEATFTQLDKPDTTFNDIGSYTATIKLSEEAAEEVEATLAPAIKKALKQLQSEGATVTVTDPKTKKVTTRPIEEGDLKLPLWKDKEGVPHLTGRVKAGGTRRDTGEIFENRVKIVDGAQDPMPSNTMIGKGSKLKLSGDLVPYFIEKDQKAGISFRLKQVQIIKLVEVRTAPVGSTVNF